LINLNVFPHRKMDTLSELRRRLNGMSDREQWGSRSGFVLSTIGAAVGIGNIWRFSYVAG